MPQVIRRLPFRVINRRHQFQFQPDAVFATLDRFSCDIRAAARVMCPKKRDWVAERGESNPRFTYRLCVSKCVPPEARSLAGQLLHWIRCGRRNFRLLLNQLVGVLVSAGDNARAERSAVPVAREKIDPAHQYLLGPNARVYATGCVGLGAPYFNADGLPSFAAS